MAIYQIICYFTVNHFPMGKINFGKILSGIVKVASLVITAKQVSEVVIPTLQKKIDASEQRKQTEKDIQQAITRSVETDKEVVERPY